MKKAKKLTFGNILMWATVFAMVAFIAFGSAFAYFTATSLNQANNFQTATFRISVNADTPLVSNGHISSKHLNLEPGGEFYFWADIIDLDTQDLPLPTSKEDEINMPEYGGFWHVFRLKLWAYPKEEGGENELLDEVYYYYDGGNSTCWVIKVEKNEDDSTVYNVYDSNNGTFRYKFSNDSTALRINKYYHSYNSEGTYTVTRDNHCSIHYNIDGEKFGNDYQGRKVMYELRLFAIQPEGIENSVQAMDKLLELANKYS